jgi:hypothetical protein
MQYRRVGKWGLKLPEISLGLWHNFGRVAPLERSREIVRPRSSSGSRTSTSRTRFSRACHCGKRHCASRLRLDRSHGEPAGEGSKCPPVEARVR